MMMLDTLNLPELLMMRTAHFDQLIDQSDRQSAREIDAIDWSIGSARAIDAIERPIG